MTTVPESVPISEAELRETYLTPTPDRKTEFTVWDDRGRLVGLLEAHASELPESDSVVCLNPRIHPDVMQSELAEEMIAWGEELARSWRGDAVEVEVPTYQNSTWVVELLEKLEYWAARVFERMSLDLAAPYVPEPVVPSYELRPLAGVDEVDAWNALFNVAFRDHYDFHRITREQRLWEMAKPSHVPELDLVAVAPDGSLAAFCWIMRRKPDDREVEWYVDLVGTLPEHRRRGLAGALISKGLAGAQERGGRRVLLEVDATSETGANRPYERLGFKVETASIDFRKRLG